MLYKLDQISGATHLSPINKDVISVYDSVPEFLAACEEMDPRFKREFDPNFHQHSYADARHYCTIGNDSYVAPSDKLIAEFENHIKFESRSFCSTYDVVGGTPSVGRYLAGHPMAMRRRIRTQSEFAPITIVADLGLRSTNTTKECENRGAAILALVRMLSSIRPVSLYIGAVSRDDTSDGTPNSTTATMVKVDTSPLDLTRAAYMTSGKSFVRKLCFGLISSQVGGYENLTTPYENMTGYLKHAHEYWNRIFPGDMIYIPRLVGGHADTVAREPVNWLIEQLAKYGSNPL